MEALNSDLYVYVRMFESESPENCLRKNIFFYYEYLSNTNIFVISKNKN